MDKKLIGLFIVLFILFSTIGSVGAVKLVNKDFDGYFTMKVPKGMHFQKDVNGANNFNIVN